MNSQVACEHEKVKEGKQQLVKDSKIKGSAL